MTVALIDSHCHLEFPAFSEDGCAVLDRARAAGVVGIVAIGNGLEAAGEPAAVRFARAQRDLMRATLGIHPHEVAQATPLLLDAVERWAGSDAVAAIGEVGLDFHYDRSPRPVQQEMFRAQIAIARRVGKPIVVHTRAAPAATIEALRDEHARDVGGVIHCFSEDVAFARSALDLGFVASFSGLVTFKTAVDVQEAARLQPAEAILIETDAPYLAPVPHRGKRNEPAWVRYTAEFVAQLRGTTLDDVSALTTANARRIFWGRAP